MALAREPHDRRDLRNGEPRIAQQLARTVYALLDHIAVRRHPRGYLECLPEVMKAESGRFGELEEAELLLQMRVHVVDHAPELRRCQSAPVRARRPRLRSVVEQEVDGAGGRQSFHVEPAASAA